MQYKIINVATVPQQIPQIAHWFSQKWGIDVAEYIKSMQQSATNANAVPQWYVATDCQRILGGLGVIDNDFHNRPDLAPNVCAVFVEEDCRGKGIAGKLLCHVCNDMAQRGVKILYLVTNHVGFYEKYNWQYLCATQCFGEQCPSRVYVHKQDDTL